MNTKQSLIVSDYLDLNQYTTCQIREQAPNAAILRADIMNNFEQYFDIFEGFYADDLTQAANHTNSRSGERHACDLSWPLF